MIAADIVNGHSTATLYEAAQCIEPGLAKVCDPGLRAVWPGARVAARAFTVRGRAGDNLALHNAVLRAPAGCVLVVDLQGGAHGYWGEILAVAAQHRGVTGLVVDGGVRDSHELAELAFPVFARMVTVIGTTKNYPGEFAVPVEVGGVTITPHDVVIGDADAVIAVPTDRLAEVVAKADQRITEERDVVTRLRSGATTVDIYHLDATRRPR